MCERYRFKVLKGFMMVLKQSDRSCYVCGAVQNPIVASETCYSEEFKKNKLPEGQYSLIKCRSCGLTYVDSDVTDQYLSQFYQLHSPESDDEYNSMIKELTEGETRCGDFSRQWQIIKTLRRPINDDRLLDIGCATGEAGMIAKEDNVSLYGHDLSKAYAYICRRRWDVGADHVISTMLEDESFPRGFFSYITSYETLEHMTNPSRVLDLMKNWLKPDGIIAISVPASDYFVIKHNCLKKFNRSGLVHGHIFNFTPKSCKLLLERSGFEPVYIGPANWSVNAAGSIIRTAYYFLKALSGSRIFFAPSVFAVAKHKAF
ncbi:MAG: class I SAM-dependent methyltransferase [Clostridia bacterium]|nr:class I SAM-dependent methyltransferase [Clostridia bacterium]